MAKDKDDKTKEAEDDAAGIKALGEALAPLAGLKDLPAALKDGFASIREDIANIGPSETPATVQQGSDFKLPTDEDMEGMTNAQLIGLVGDIMREGVVKPLRAEMSNMGTQSSNDDVAKQVANLQREFPDFMEWQSEMGDLVKKHPSYADDIRDLYDTVKRNNPEKVAQIAAVATEKDEEINQAKEEEQRKEDEEKGQERDKEGNVIEAEKRFGGLLPTSQPNLASEEDEGAGNQDQKDAGLSAWDEVMGPNANRI